MRKTPLSSKTLGILAYFMLLIGVVIGRQGSDGIYAFAIFLLIPITIMLAWNLFKDDRRYRQSLRQESINNFTELQTAAGKLKTKGKAH